MPCCRQRAASSRVQDALDAEFSFPDLAHFVHVGPVQRGLRDALGHVEAFGHRAGIAAVAFVAGSAGVQSFGRRRRSVSRLRPVAMSTVRSIAVQPAASTRFSSVFAVGPDGRRVDLED